MWFQSLTVPSAAHERMRLVFGCTAKSQMASEWPCNTPRCSSGSVRREGGREGGRECVCVKNERVQPKGVNVIGLGGSTQHHLSEKQ